LTRDELFDDYRQHLESFGSGDKAYSSPQSTAVSLWPQQGGVLGACKSSSAGNMSNPGGACLVTCATVGS
jgi:hypothetical protein